MTLSSKADLIRQCQLKGIVGNRNMHEEKLSQLIKNYDAGMKVPKRKSRKSGGSKKDHYQQEEKLVKLLETKEERVFGFDEFHIQKTSDQISESEYLLETETNEVHELAKGKHPILTSLLNSWAQLAEEQKVNSLSTH